MTELDKQFVADLIDIERNRWHWEEFVIGIGLGGILICTIIIITL